MKRDRIKQRLHGLLGPGKRLMARLHLPTKLGLLATLVVAPLLVLVVYAGIGARAALATLDNERAGVVVSGQLVRVFDAVQGMRLAVARSPGADATADADLRTARAHLSAALQVVNTRVAEGGELLPGDEWGRLRMAAEALANKPVPAHRDAAVRQVAEVAAAATRLMARLGERAQLAFDPDPQSSLLNGIASDHLWGLMDATAATAAAGVLLADRGQLSDRERDALAMQLEGVERERLLAEQHLEALVRTGAPLPVAWTAATQGVRRLVNTVRGAVEGPLPPSAVGALTSQGHETLTLLQRAGAEVLDDLDARLVERASARQLQVAWQLVLLAGGLLAAVYLGSAFCVGFVESLGVLRSGVQRIAAGDLACEVAVQGSEELAAMAVDLDRMIETLSALVAEIRSCAVRVDQAGADVANDGRALAERTEMQTYGLRDAVQSVRMLSSTVASNATVVASLDRRTESLGGQGTACSEVMERSVQALRELDESVRRVAEINAVIDDIAFQTNLLSLNASVEAARAGETGKGFGVVAAEVRALSLRCSEAAAEVRELIDRTAGHCAHSSDSVAEAQRLLEALVGSVSAASGDLKRIAAVGNEQSSGLEAVSRSVGDLDNITHGNAKAVAAASQAAQALANHARVLRHSVGSIRLRQGGADEARALVESALMRVAEIGWRHAAAEFSQTSGPFVDRDMHLCAIDAEGRYLAHGADPQLVGKAVFELPTMSHGMAEDYLERARAAAAAGGGWIDYQVLDTGGHRQIGKSAYIVPIDDGGFLGCAVRRQAAQAEAAADAAASAAHTASAATAVMAKVTAGRDDDAAAAATAPAEHDEDALVTA